MAIEVVVGYPYSDIGKGWLTSSLGAQIGDPMIFKIDPALKPSTPPEVGVLLDGVYVTPDVKAYQRRGLSFSPQQNIMMGGFLAEALQNQPAEEGTLEGEIAPPLTYADISMALAKTIDMQMQKAGKTDAVIEIGGSADDPEAGPIPGAIRLLAQKYPTGIVALTKFDFTTEEGKYDIKTRVPVRGIETTMRTYWGLPLHAAFIRRGNVPEVFEESELRKACIKIAFKSQIDPRRVVYVPNVKHLEELDNYTTLFRRSVTSRDIVQAVLL